MPGIFSENKRSKIMRSVKSKNTKCELALRKELTKSGLRGYRVNYSVTGHPDIAYTKRKVAVFCDSDFWHGLSVYPKSNSTYWKAKLDKNRARDKRVNECLGLLGWKVIRFKESRILKDTRSCVEEIKAALLAEEK